MISRLRTNARNTGTLLAFVIGLLSPSIASCQGISDAISSSIASDFFRPTLDVQSNAGSVAGLNVDSSHSVLTILLSQRDVAVWSVTTGVELARFHAAGAQFAASNAPGTVVLAETSDGSVTAYTADGSVVASARLGGTAAGVVFVGSQRGYAASSAGVVAFDAKTHAFMPVSLPAGGATTIGYGGASGDAIVATQAGDVFAIAASRAASLLGHLPLTASTVSGCQDEPIVLATTNDGSIFTITAGATQKSGQTSGSVVAIDRTCKFVAQGSSDGTVNLNGLGAGRDVSLAPSIKLGLKESPVVGIFLDSGLGHVISAEKSGMVRIWDLAARRDVLQVYMTAKGWAVIDQNGRFDGSQEGMLDVGWLAKSQRVTLNQFSDKYFEPGLLSDYMAPDARAPLSNIATVSDGMVLPPKLDVQLPASAAIAATPAVVIVLAEDQGGGVGPTSLYHNGKLVPAGSFLQQQETTANGHHILAAAYRVTPTSGPNTFSATSSSTHGANGGLDQAIIGRSKTVSKVFDGPPDNSTLYLVMVGVSNYQDTFLDTGDMKIVYPTADARAIAASFEQQTGNHFSSIVPLVLTDGQATLASVKNALAGLGQTKPSDVVVLYLAGHGEILNNDWNFITVDGHLKQTDLTSATLREALVAAPAQRMFVMIDSCQSGETAIAFNRFQTFQRRFMRELSSSAGVAVLAAARANQFAAETDALGHGLFTKAVLDGLSGKADVAHDGVVTAHELMEYTSVEMAVLAAQTGIAGLQQPAAFALGADFILH